MKEKPDKIKKEKQEKKEKPEPFGSDNGQNQETLLGRTDYSSFVPFGWDDKTMGSYDSEGQNWVGGTP
ncbi:hypothetical protein A2130_03950 [Candidatus Woesebacteria bacterium GWC2_33_12]|uniref:Uncharacterized protein n=1 Tax=Candidatus Woesebacteria bacterium GW2011_GWB1_33_22 TaxID=1618566 RepID=A0A0G0CQA0_9BACT|nr:MAG: hypothetical protein UR29_C0001G0112 [Candidatus Woesebacteria bacterium GW2011_GWC2_33_12]KKP42678.1 MAG: hypothetical protein UR33_C0001G0039 [Candidatus Woesebacteria bacterium GW2011_GWA2_33_20]KKP45547.1 MAG: hypothetical protein UR35_C0001G0144 [Candidatus Woesebacteria bacterium GW2011_GWB1_33_22]KKP47419.1 MAG: hypothetical protein UR37_C0001G0112 [Microgenomates group bacterium GW2011_GWC1_33_28]KKP51165.1 MAG: hypothetical protein UR41_C0001G0112 [Candidatus Woesebacteria bact